MVLNGRANCAKAPRGGPACRGRDASVNATAAKNIGGGGGGVVAPCVTAADHYYGQPFA